MNLNYQDLIPEDFNPDSKVWIYQSSRSFTTEEITLLEAQLATFVKEWESHGSAVKGFAHLFFGQFIVFIADDSDSRICGRSIDSIARFVKELEIQFDAQLMDRETLAFAVNDRILLLHLSQLKHSIEKQVITGETLYFNNLVTDKKSFLSKWLIPAKNSWLSVRIGSLQIA